MARGEARFHGSDQFWIHELERLPDASTWVQSNGLTIAAEFGAVVITSEYMGEIQVTVDAREERPPEADEPDGLGEGRVWDDIVEISVTSIDGPLLVVPLEDDVDLPRLDACGPGDYRLRVHARNRDVHVLDEEGLERSTDEYLIVSWPEPRRPDLAVRLTDLRGYGTRFSLSRVRGAGRS